MKNENCCEKNVSTFLDTWNHFFSVLNKNFVSKNVEKKITLFLQLMNFSWGLLEELVIDLAVLEGGDALEAADGVCLILTTKTI